MTGRAKRLPRRSRSAAVALRDRTRSWWPPLLRPPWDGVSEHPG